MNEEMRNENVDNEELMETEVDQEISGGGLFGKLLFGAVVIGAGLAGLAYKNRDKLEERRIKKLEKKGYIVCKKVENDDDSENVVEETEE